MSESVSTSNKITNGNSSSTNRDDANKGSFAQQLKPSGSGGFSSPQKERRASVMKSGEYKVKEKRNYQRDIFVEHITFEGTKNEEHKKRFDRMGVEINSKNKKKIKISFVDTALGKPLVEVINIESYKDFNVIGYSPPEKEVFGKTSTCCSCNVF